MTPAQAGYLTAFTAKKYYSNLTSAYVKIQAVGNGCVYLEKWSGDGPVYVDHMLPVGEPDLDHPLDLDDPNSPVTESGVWVEMGPPNSVQVRTLTAVLNCGKQVLVAMYNNPEITAHPNNSVYSPAPACGELVTDIEGHPLEYENPGNFSYQELSCNCSDHSHWQWDDTVSALFQAVRDEYGSPITVSSAFRCPTRNNTVSYPRAGSKHCYGRAFDWAMGSEQNWDVAIAAREAGVSEDRIFLYGGGTSLSLPGIVAAGGTRTSPPNGWSSYTNGHADSGN